MEMLKEILESNLVSAIIALVGVRMPREWNRR